MTEINSENMGTGLEIAVIGMDGRFPGAASIDEFWENLEQGRETISFLSEEELIEAGNDPFLIRSPNYVKAKGILKDVECFDSSFFGYTPKEAEIMDPQIRFFYECSWKALENAGYDPGTYEGLIGLYVGAHSSFLWEARMLLSGKVNHLGHFASSQLNDKDYLSQRLSYKLDLRGPSYSLQTACSTSLTAVHLACQGLLSAECDMALAGGVSISIPQKQGYLYQDEMIMSPDGRCRAFDARANGTVFGDGIGVAVFKRIDDALAEGDNIYAIIKGSAVNNDGISKPGFQAPGINGQAEVIRAAHKMAEVDPETITYVETHGTGTDVGDPIEIEALTRAFATPKKGFCRIGSVKTNVGHLNTAAGITGFIKTVLALKHRKIPASLHLESPNPRIDFENSPFILNRELTGWTSDGYPLRAGVSSFGIGGTNAHVVLEEAPEASDIKSNAGSRTYRLIVLSAKTGRAVEMAAKNLAEYFKRNSNTDIADAAYTLQVGRRAFNCKRMLVCSGTDEAAEILSSADPGKLHSHNAESKDSPLVFMFPGQGAQYVNMGLELYRKEQVFREEMDHCFDIVKPLTEYNLRDILYPSEADEPQSASLINRTDITQPLIFIFEYALAKLIMSWGISPDAMIGHSIGEYTAACLAGVFSLTEASKLVVLRGRFMQTMPTGSMLNVLLPEEQLTPLLDEELSLAAVNGPSNCTVSGTSEKISQFEMKLEEMGHKSRYLNASHAFHSGMMEPMTEYFENEVRKISPGKPEIPYISNISGNWLQADEVSTPGYWSRHLRETVQFSRGIGELLKKEDVILVEVGPGRVLSTLVKQRLTENSKQLTVNLIPHSKERVPADYYLLNKIGVLWLTGKNIDWKGYYCGERRRRVPLPTYPFEKKRFEAGGHLFGTGIEADTLLERTSLNQRRDISNWFYIPSWKSTVLPVKAKIFDFNSYLFFVDERGVGPGLANRMEQEGYEVILVKKGAHFSRENTREYTINPGQPEDYRALLEDLGARERVPGIIVHMWAINEDEKSSHRLETKLVDIEHTQTNIFYSLIFLARLIGKLHHDGKLKLVVISNGLHSVTGESGWAFEKAMLMGPVKVIPNEFANIQCRNVDILVPPDGSPEMKRLFQQLCSEVTAETSDEIVAYRSNIRWVRSFEPVPWEKTGECPRLTSGGVYLITGGLGGMGLVLAGYLARQVKAKLILVSRSGVPPREEWDNRLNNGKQAHILTSRIRQLLELEKMGAEVMIICADVSDPEQVGRAIRQGKQRFGTINGVIHCAGQPGGEMIQRMNREVSKGIFDAKVKGALVLDAEFGDMNLDLFVMCSSIYSLLGPSGQVTYCAANACLDAFALFRSKSRNTFTVSINWDGWHGVGMAAGFSGELNTGLTPEEGVDVFSRILAGTLPRVVVSTHDLLKRIKSHRVRSFKKSISTSLTDSNGSGDTLERSLLPGTPFVPPQGEIETKLAEIWCEYLGISQVGIHDNFFDLGASSLDIINIKPKIEEVIGREISNVEMYTYPTIQNLMEYIGGEIPGHHSDNETGHLQEKKPRGKDKLAQRKKKIKEREK